MSLLLDDTWADEYNRKLANGERPWESIPKPSFHSTPYGS